MRTAYWIFAWCIKLYYKSGCDGAEHKGGGGGLSLLLHLTVGNRLKIIASNDNCYKASKTSSEFFFFSLLQFSFPHLQLIIASDTVVFSQLNVVKHCAL